MTHEMPLVGRRKLEYVDSSCGLFHLDETSIGRKEYQILEKKISDIDDDKLDQRATSSTWPVSRFFHWKCNNPSSPLTRTTAPFVGDGSTVLEVSRRKARPALNARRMSDSDMDEGETRVSRISFSDLLFHHVICGIQCRGGPGLGSCPWPC